MNRYYEEKRNEPKEIIIITPNDKPQSAAQLLAVLRTSFVPNRILAVTADGKAQAKLASLVPLVRGKIAQQNIATAYVCQSRQNITSNYNPAHD